MVDRRAFLALFATSAGASLFADGVNTQIQPGTLKISPATVREAARLAGLTWSEEESEEVVDALSSFAKHAEKIDKDRLDNASPLPIQFDPRPPGVAVRVPPASFRPPPPIKVQRPARLEEVAFYPSIVWRSCYVRDKSLQPS
jgi:hypothetical protein